MTRENLLGEDVFVIRDFLSAAECAAFIAASEGEGYEEAPVGEVLLKRYRSNTRLMVDDPQLGRELFTRIRPFLPADLGGVGPIGLNERFRYYRYDPGEYFAPHYDGVFQRSETEASALTLMLYLNDDFEGGSTDFYHEDQTVRLSVVPERGMALVFRHAIFHAGCPVRSGRKYVLRTDVMYGRKRFTL
ncbi:MAG: hypothetical protein K0Q72_2383 [Armatimonadetes bacterium]|jgi:hypothetical protein|nr:hypothetical protein [Armatimonadota bacterium]